MKNSSIFLIFFLLFLAHLPFLTADPDKSVDVHTRGAWTDEGLYAGQVRNFLNGGDFDMDENTTFIRGPLFDLIRIPFFFILGSSLWLARLITIAGVLLGLIILARNRETKLFAVFLILTTFLQFRIFHFSHYAMSEMLAVSAVLISYFFLSKYFRTDKKKFLFLSVLMIFVAWGLKIQFLYLIVLLPLVVLIFDLFKFLDRAISLKRYFADVLWVSFFSFGFLLLYIIIWYLPNKDYYNRIMFEQTDRRFEVWESLYGTIDFNFSTIVIDQFNIVLLLAFVAAMVILIRVFHHQKNTFPNRLIIIFGAAWLFIELHKLGMVYLPQRYLLSFYASAGFFSSSILFQVFHQNQKLKTSLILMLSVALILNGWFIYNSYSNRTYELKKVNNYLRHYNWEGETIAGVWAPAVSWGTKARVIPVWKDYHDPEIIFNRYNPELIIEEPNEGTSEELYKEHLIDLAEMSDSIKAFKLWRYDINLYWLGNDNDSIIKKPQ
jgi:hypothetical protein